MSTTSKTEIEAPASNFEDDSHDLRIASKFRMSHMVNNARLALTVVALAAAITILGVSADSIAVYNATHVPDNFFLPLWPGTFNLRPTVALIVSSAVVIVVNGLSLVISRTQLVHNRATIHASFTFAVPAIALSAAVVAVVFFYIVDASTTVDSLQSWTCRWKDVSMMTKPHFGTLCKQSEAGIALSLLLVPLEAMILGVAAYQAVLKRQLDNITRGSERKAGSPALS